MNDDMMFDYMLQMGAMRPDEEELRRKQAMVEALRKGSMQGPQGSMVGNHYVAPSITQNLAQVAQGYAAGQAQQGVDAKQREMNANQRNLLTGMQNERKRRKGYDAPEAWYLGTDSMAD